MLDDEKGLTLSKVAQRGATRVFHVHREASELATRTATGGKAPVETRKRYKSEQEATREYHKVTRAKFRDGYALLRERASAPRGAVVFAGFASGGGGGPVLDVSPDGRYALTAGHSGAPRSVWVERIDLATGERKVIFERSHPTQIFLHSAHFERDEGRILVSLSDNIERAPIDGGKTEVVGTFRSKGTRHPFNPHVLRPLQSADRGRAVLFDERLQVNVVEERFDPVLAVPTMHETTECRGVGLSSSGKLLAVFRVSRGIVYNHDDAKHDATCEVEIWDIDKAKKIAVLPMERQIDRLGFDPTDRLLLATHYYAAGPVAYSLETGKQAFAFSDGQGEGGLARAHDFTCSPDGSLLAIASGATCLYDAATRAPIEVEPFGLRATLVVFARGLLVSFEDGLCVARSTG